MLRDAFRAVEKKISAAPPKSCHVCASYVLNVIYRERFEGGVGGVHLPKLAVANTD